MSRLEHDHDVNPHFPHTLRAIYQRFQDQAVDTRPHCEVLLHQDGVKFLGAWTGLQNGFDPRAFRRSLNQMLGLEKFRMIQVVGDSGSAFAAEGLQIARETILRLVMEHGDVEDSLPVLEYGYTASRHDTNWIVNDIIAQMPRLGPRTIANIVHMSITAVESWDCEAIRNVAGMVLAYHEKENTVFGGDVWLSDSVMDASAGDILVCLEGGPQAFAQATGVCLNGVPVIAVTGPRMRTSDMSERFSAAHMLEMLCRELSKCTNRRSVTRTEREKIRAEAVHYLDSQELLRAHSRRPQYELVQDSLTALLGSLDSLEIVQIVHAT